tara:strand:+ start:13120 stop:14589 length:1470 start_codon:yes stop_codon:yes gene_type:complete
MSVNITVYPNYSPRVIQVDSPQTSASVQELIDAIRDWEDSITGQYYDFLISAAGKELLGGGVSVGITATLENAQIYFEARSVAVDSTKLVTTASSNGRLVISSTSTFISDGILRGDTIINDTTMAMQTVLTIDSETQLTCLPLTGGSRQDWQIGDSIYSYNQVQGSVSGGNMVAVDSVGAELAPILEAPMVQVVRTAASSATATSQESLEFGLFAGGVAWKPSSLWTIASPPASGVVGTREYPLNNMTDVATLLDTKGLTSIWLMEDATLTGIDISNKNYHFVGDNPFITLTVDPSADATGAAMEHLSLQGELDGVNTVVDCWVKVVTGVSGIFQRCGFYSDCTMIGATSILDCYSFVAGTGQPQFYLAAMAGASLQVRNWSGSFSINGSVGGTHSIHMTGGRFHAQADNTGGTFSIRGNYSNAPNDLSQVGCTISDESDTTLQLREIYKVMGLDASDPVVASGDGVATKTLVVGGYTVVITPTGITRT